MMQSNNQRVSYRPSVPRISGPYPVTPQQHPAVQKIHHYFVWSIINVFIAGVIPGLIAVLFSYFTREQKRQNDFWGAKKWSKRTLICNILTNVCCLFVCIVIIIGLAVGLGVGYGTTAGSSQSTLYTCSCNCTGTCACNINRNIFPTVSSCGSCTNKCIDYLQCTTGSVTGYCAGK